MLTTQSSSPVVRRAPGPWASQPRVGQMMLACVAGARAAALEGDALFGDDWVSAEFLLGEAMAAMAASNSFDLTEIVSRTLGAVIDEEAGLTLNREEAALVRGLGLAGRRTRGLIEYLEGALVGASAYHRSRGRRLMERYSACVGIKRRVTDICAEAMKEAPRVPLAETKALLHAEAIDAEALCWAVVGVEGRRHVPLVLKEANRAARDWPDRGADGLIGYAWQGLRLALYNYDPERGMFSTYACPRIRGAIRDGIRAESHLPKRLTTFVNKVERAREALTQRLGRHPTLEEVAQSLDLDLDRLAALRHLGAPVSLNDLVERDEGFTVVGGMDPEAVALEQDRKRAIAEAMATLDPDDAVAVQLMVLEAVSVGDCQERTGMSARQLRQRRDRGLEQLAGMLSEWSYV